ncbi:MAG: hypothetical protein A2W31_02770 [Planctomycetes bacterium RBG_16_64_10]|nr:MAG: hypothetical protein A2W31_02770 [Planctomycetes bacterium RBG_16_64_10]
MNEQGEDALVKPQPPGSISSDSAGTSAHSGRLCDKADDPCQVCKGMGDVRVVRSDELLQGKRELFIVHGNQVYRLLRTRNDKLILQK